jgi:hypothetical protein
MNLVKGGSISIRINEENSTYFKLGKGLRQGDPLSPLLFNLVIDVFSKMLGKAGNKGYITGLLSSLYLEGVVSLQYVDNTLLFLDHDYNSVCHLKWLMVCFEKLPGMKINYHKSDLSPVNLDEDESHRYAQIFCCKLGSFPFKYLGVPLHYDELRREDIQPIVNVLEFPSIMISLGGKTSNQ